MSEEKKTKKEINKEECCEGKQKLSIEELDKVNGGAKPITLTLIPDPVD